MSFKIKRRSLLGALLLMLLLWLLMTLLTGSNLVHATAPTIPELVAQKTEQTQQQRAQGEVAPELAGYTIPQFAAPSLSQSGMRASVLLIRDADFRYFGQLGYYVEYMSVAANALQAGQPVLFDAPESFKFTPLQGKIHLNAVQIDAMMNRLLSTPRAPLRNLTTSFKHGQLRLSGQMQRKGKWSEFGMEGALIRVDDKTLKFHPDNISVGGQSATALMAQVNLTVDELISIRLPEVQLRGNDLYLSLDKVFPAPQMDVHAKSIALTDAGLSIELYNPQVAQAPKIPDALAGSKSFMQVMGGDVQFIKARMVNARVNILPQTADERVAFELYHYQNQLARSEMRTASTGEMTVKMPAPLPLSKQGSAGEHR